MQDGGWRAPLRDIQTTLAHMIPDAPPSADRAETGAADAGPDQDVLQAALVEAGRLIESRFAPLNRTGDQVGAQLDNGVVRTPPGFREAFAALAAGGWVGMAARPEQGGLGMPLTFQAAVSEMQASSCLSLSLCALLSQGAIDALERHGDAEQQALYLPRLIDGSWTGAMCLTEPQAGTDVGALRTRATPCGDGTYAIEGGKIWISWGDHDMAENVVHLVLARLPDAPPGPKGISLFLTPKFLPGAEGGLGARNAMQVVSLDHKMGLHGSPACVMAYDGATGWLVGAPGDGLACMFTMMNNARLGVGLEGVGVAEAATQKALAYAQQRIQGRPPVGDGTGPIFDHADVRRMLLSMRTLTQAARGVAYECAHHLELARSAATEEARAAGAAMGAFLTPIAKAFGTDVGCEVADLGIQVHGGTGYIEETGAAQYLRDVRITAIYEGTNGVQAMDLVGRKLQGDGGATALLYLNDIDREAEEWIVADDGADRVELGRALHAAVSVVRGVVVRLTGAEATDLGAGAVHFLRAVALLGGMASLGRAAALSPERMALARFFAHHHLPFVKAHGEAALIGGDRIYAAGLGAFEV